MMPKHLRKFFAHIYQKRLNNQAGAAALMFVIIAMMVLMSIALNYLGETEQEQAGSALTYTSLNAQLIAEAGLSFAEKCLKQNKSGCPCYNAICSSTSSCCNSNWPNLINVIYSSIPFGDTRGSFRFIVTSATTTVARVTSTGTFGGATREMSKNVILKCPLSQNAVTTCQSITTINNATISPPTAPTQTGECSEPSFPTLTFPTGYTGCPNSTYPAFAGTLASPYQYCSWSQTSDTVTVNGDITIYVAGDVTISNNAVLNINGNVTINVGGDIDIKNNAAINIASGSLTMHTMDDFTLENSATMNYPSGGSAGNPSKLMVLVEGTGQLQNTIQFSGALYGPDMDMQMENSAKFVGAVVADQVELKNSITLTFDATAGSTTSGYSFCGSSSAKADFGGG